MLLPLGPSSAYGHGMAWDIEHLGFAPEFVDYIGEIDINDDTQVVCQRFAVDGRYPVKGLEAWDAET